MPQRARVCPSKYLSIQEGRETDAEDGTECLSGFVMVDLDGTTCLDGRSEQHRDRWCAQRRGSSPCTNSVSSPLSGFSKSCEEVIFATSAAEGKVYDTELYENTPEAAVRSGGIGMTQASLEDRIGERVVVVAFFGVEAREAVY